MLIVRGNLLISDRLIIEAQACPRQASGKWFLALFLIVKIKQRRGEYFSQYTNYNIGHAQNLPQATKAG